MVLEVGVNVASKVDPKAGRHQPRRFANYREQAEVLQPMMTQEEVAAALGMTQQNCARIESVAMKKLRAALAREGLTLEDLL